MFLSMGCSDSISSIKQQGHGIIKYYQLHKQRLAELQDDMLDISFTRKEQDRNGSMLISMSHNGHKSDADNISLP